MLNYRKAEDALNNARKFVSQRKSCSGQKLLEKSDYFIDQLSEFRDPDPDLGGIVKAVTSALATVVVRANGVIDLISSVTLHHLGKLFHSMWLDGDLSHESPIHSYVDALLKRRFSDRMLFGRFDEGYDAASRRWLQQDPIEVTKQQRVSLKETERNTICIENTGTRESEWATIAKETAQDGLLRLADRLNSVLMSSVQIDTPRRQVNDWCVLGLTRCLVAMYPRANFQQYEKDLRILLSALSKWKNPRGHRALEMAIMPLQNTALEADQIRCIFRNQLDDTVHEFVREAAVSYRNDEDNEKLQDDDNGMF